MLETMGISGYMQAVKLNPSPAVKNANKLALKVSHDSLKRLLSALFAGAGGTASASFNVAFGAVNRLEGLSAALSFCTVCNPSRSISNVVSFGG